MRLRPLGNRAAAGALAVLIAGCAPQGTLAPVENDAALRPRGEEGWHDLGLRLLAASEPAAAEKAFKRALVEEGVTAPTMTGAGIAAAMQGHLGSARAYLERARVLDPESLDVNNNLGVVYYRLGQYRAAQQAFQTAFVVSSGTNPFAALNLRLSEEAVAAQGLEGPLDPAVAFALRRTGGSEYRLDPLDPEVAAERGVAEEADPGAPGPETAPLASAEAAPVEAPATGAEGEGATETLTLTAMPAELFALDAPADGAPAARDAASAPLADDADGPTAAADTDTAGAAGTDTAAAAGTDTAAAAGTDTAAAVAAPATTGAAPAETAAETAVGAPGRAARTRPAGDREDAPGERG